MAKDRYAPKALGEIMGNLNRRLATYAGKTKELSVQQGILNDFLGEKLSKKCRVSNYQDATLMIEAISAPVALRLSYLKMDMLSHFRANGLVELGQIKITTNPQVAQRLTTLTGPEQKTATSSKRLMSEQTANYLSAIAVDAPPSLKAKLERLAQHGRKGKV